MPRWFGLREKLALQCIAAVLPLLLVLASDLPARLWIAAPVAVGALALIAWLGNRSIIRPLRHLTAVADRLTNGDFSARASPMGSTAYDLVALGHSVDALAEKLQQRERAVALAQAEYGRSEREMRMLAEYSSDIIVRLDGDMRRRYVSPAVRTILGTSERDYLARDLLAGVHPDDLDRMRTLMARLDKAPTQDITYRQQRADGRYVWLEAIWRRLEEDQGWVVVYRDVTRRRRTEDWINDANRRLRALATQDGLTGLANRRHFDDMLDQEFTRARRDQKPMGLVLLDVDHFKSFNDHYGHPAGDDCLKRVAAIIRASLRSTGDVAARYGGEEVGVILPGASMEETGLVAERIRAAVHALNIPHAGGVGQRVTISAGVATLDDEHQMPGLADLVDAADRALYLAKQSGRDQVQVASKPVAV